METRELVETALRHLDPEQGERRCELMLALARAQFLLFDLRTCREMGRGGHGVGKASSAHRSRGACRRMAGRSPQAKGDLDEARFDGPPGAGNRARRDDRRTACSGPLTLYLAGRSPEALVLAADGAASAQASRDTTLIMYSLLASRAESDRGWTLRGSGRRPSSGTRGSSAGSTGAHSMLARATAMAAGLH